MSLVRSEGPDGVTLLRIDGEVDLLTAGALADEATTATMAARGVVLDLSQVTFFDSSGVRLVDSLARACDRNGAGFRVVAPTGSRARRVLDLVGLGDALASEDEAAALAALR